LFWISQWPLYLCDLAAEKVKAAKAAPRKDESRREPQIPRRKTDYTEAKAPSNKFQNPNKREARNNKFKTRVYDIAPFEFVVLPFVWSLVLGIWDFGVLLIRAIRVLSA
jgi:hypothetical protein